MFKRNFSLLMVGLFIVGLTTAQANAEEEAVLPPPTEVRDSETARETFPAPEKEEDLEDALVPDDSEGVEVRAYTREDGSEVNEYSKGGRVYMVKVQPAGGMPAYYLYDSDGDGIFEKRLPGGYKRPSPPMWIIKKF